MKKCYKAPELMVVFVNLEGVIADSQNIGIEEGTEGEETSAQYRSSLWND